MPVELHKLVRLLAGMAWVSALASAMPASAQTPVRGSAASCETGAITGTGGDAARTLTLCSRLLAEVPALTAQLARLNALGARDEETRRDLQRFGATLNDMARRLKQQDNAALASAVAERLQRTLGGSESALLNEIDRLRVSMREMNQKVDELRSQPALQRRTDAAVSGEAGRAMAQLDFEAAKGVLDSLQRIESKIDDAQGPYAANPALLAMVRNEALSGYEKARQLGAPARCTRGWSSLGTLLAAAEDTFKQGKVNAAGLSYKDMSERAGQMLGELSMLDSMREAQQQIAQRQEEMHKTTRQRNVERATSVFDRRRAPAAQQARTAALRSRLAEADAMRSRALQMAEAGDAQAAADLLIDGANLLGRIESEGGNYRMPLEDIPKIQGRTSPFAAALPGLKHAATADEASLLPVGSICR